MVVLERIYTRIENDEVFFCSKVNIDGNEHELYFSTDKRFEKYISQKNGDCFNLVLFIYSIFERKSFVSKVPISKRLKYGIKDILLDTFEKKGFYDKNCTINFLYEDDTTHPNTTAIGAAMSFGVDSFYTLCKNLSSDNSINTLTLFNAGAFGQYGGSVARELFNKMKKHVSDFAKRLNMDFLWVDTNLNEILPMPFVKTHTFRNFACVLAFQKLFKSYYYASGIKLDNFKLNFNDPAYYDVLNSKAISSNSLEFHISGLNSGRLLKTQTISNFKLTFQNLNVCLLTSDNTKLDKNNSKLTNCSRCFKCIRTMITLDVIGKLPLYEEVFDLKIYQKNKTKYWAEIIYLYLRTKNIFSVEILNEAKKRKYKIPFGTYTKLILRAMKPIKDRLNIFHY